jgi:hypothetical protein
MKKDEKSAFSTFLGAPARFGHVQKYKKNLKSSRVQTNLSLVIYD